MACDNAALSSAVVWGCTLIGPSAFYRLRTLEIEGKIPSVRCSLSGGRYFHDDTRTRYEGRGKLMLAPVEVTDRQTGELL